MSRTDKIFAGTIVAILVGGFSLAIVLGRSAARERETARVARCRAALAVVNSPSDSLRLIRVMPECLS